MHADRGSLSQWDQLFRMQVVAIATSAVVPVSLRRHAHDLLRGVLRLARQVAALHGVTPGRQLL